MKYFIIVQKIGKNMLEMKKSIKKSFFTYATALATKLLVGGACVIPASWTNLTSVLRLRTISLDIVEKRISSEIQESSGLVLVCVALFCSAGCCCPWTKLLCFHVKITRCHHDSSVFSTRPFPRIQERARPSENFNESARESVVVVPFSYTYFGLTVVFGSKIGNFEKIYAAAASVELFIAEFAY